MHLVLADRYPTPTEEVRRREWIARCVEVYSNVYRGLIAIGAPADEAADALQDAFEDALQVRSPATSPDGWLFVVARRKWRRARWRRRIFHPLDGFVGETASTERDLEIDLVTELGRLTRRQRTVIAMRYVLGLSHREIAELLSIAPGTVSATVHQATGILREKLKERLDE